jgi:uncharacterized protein YjbJ (UPF0337 family)
MEAGDGGVQREVCMANDITKGKSKQIKGRSRVAFGKLTGKKGQQIKGKAERAAGEVQEQYGKAKRNIGTLVD